MNANLWTQLLIAIVPALITGIGSLFIALKKCKSEIKTLEINNKHEIEKLMKQHEIDIENLKEKYRLQFEAKQQEHDLKIKEMKIECENEILKKEKEFENQAKYGAMGDIFKGMFSSPELKKEIDKKIKEEFNKNK